MHGERIYTEKREIQKSPRPSEGGGGEFVPAFQQNLSQQIYPTDTVTLHLSRYGNSSSSKEIYLGEIEDDISWIEAEAKAAEVGAVLLEMSDDEDKDVILELLRRSDLEERKCKNLRA